MIIKIITKTLDNRLNVVLLEIIHTTQSAFIPGRLITDNGLIAFETSHYMKKIKGKNKLFYT